MSSRSAARNSSFDLAAQAREAGKPIVLLMPGKSARAREAAQSHTGALAGDHATATALLKREAVVVVDSLDELFDTTAILARFPLPSASGTAFVTGSGAMKNIALDFADDIGLELPALTAPTVQRLTELLPGYAVAENPLDYTTIGVRNPGLIGEIIDTMLADDERRQPRAQHSRRARRWRSATRPSTCCPRSRAPPSPRCWC